MRRQPKLDYQLDDFVLNRIDWFNEELMGWYEAHGRSFPWREPDRTPYEVVIAEILLQRTRAESVVRHYEDFLRKYSTWSVIANTRVDELQEDLRPLGLWRQKSLALKSLASTIMANGGRLPINRVDLENLPAIGQYIANAILVSFNQEPVPLMDVNMARVLERVFGPRNFADIRDDSYLQTLSRRLLQQAESPLHLNWAILDLGGLVCTARNPNCEKCPLNTHCQYYHKTPPTGL